MNSVVLCVIAGIVLLLWFVEVALPAHRRNKLAHRFDGMRMGSPDSLKLHRVHAPLWWQMTRRNDVRRARATGLATSKVTLIVHNEPMEFDAIEIVQLRREYDETDADFAARLRAVHKAKANR